MKTRMLQLIALVLLAAVLLASCANKNEGQTETSLDLASSASVSEGDEKLMLRMQNKYRNLLKKQPERVAAAAKEAGIPEEKTFRRRQII